MDAPWLARHAPSGANAQPWHYIVVTDPAVSRRHFAVRLTEHGVRLRDLAAKSSVHVASAMMVMGGKVNGGLYGTAPSLSTDPGNPTLENNAGDVKFETDFRSVYAQVIDGWLGNDSVKLLGANFKKSGLGFI